MRRMTVLPHSTTSLSTEICEIDILDALESVAKDCAFNDFLNDRCKVDICVQIRQRLHRAIAILLRNSSGSQVPMTAIPLDLSPIPFECIHLGPVQDHTYRVQKCPPTAVGGLDERLLRVGKSRVFQEVAGGQDAMQRTAKLMRYTADEICTAVSANRTAKGNRRLELTAFLSICSNGAEPH